MVSFSTTGLLLHVALFPPGTTHDCAIGQAGPSIWSRLPPAIPNRGVPMWLARTRRSSRLVLRRRPPRGEWCVKLPSVLMIALALSVPAAPVEADYKSEFAMSIVFNEEAPWGRAAARFAE